MENVEIKSEKVEFNTVAEVIENEYFIERVKDIILELVKTRSARPEPKPGDYYKRDWYDRMSESYMLNSAFFIESIPAIWCKKSNLPVEIRKIILTVCNNALVRTIDYYKNK